MPNIIQINCRMKVEVKNDDSKFVFFNVKQLTIKIIITGTIIRQLKFNFPTFKNSLFVI